MKPDLGQEIELTIDRLGINGEGVGQWRGFTVFVFGALPTERIIAKVYEVRKNFARAKILERLDTSPHRAEPPCPLFGRCGGCQLMHLSYEQQLRAKQQRVVDALKRIAKIDIDVAPCIPSPQRLAYRNKIQLPVSANLRLGLYAHNTHDLIEIEKCYIHCELGERVFQQVQELLKKHPAGNLRHVLIKTAVHTQQVLVILVTHTNEPLTVLAEAIFESMPEIKGVMQNINPAEGNVVLSNHFGTLVGKGAIEERLCNLTFKVSPASFFQVNPAQAENLYQKVVQLAHLTGDERVLDAYCGVGTLSLILAQHAKEVVGIESVAAAIEDAKENAQRNQIHNAKFICGLAEESINTLEKIDVAVLNPPRKGCESSFLEKLAHLKPKRIVYVSCDPATLARDLQLLTQKGYTVNTVQPFDMFPQTMHVESVSLLVISG